MSQDDFFCDPCCRDQSSADPTEHSTAPHVHVGDTKRAQLSSSDADSVYEAQGVYAVPIPVANAPAYPTMVCVMLPPNMANIYPTPVLVPYVDPSFALSQPVLAQSVPQPMRHTRAHNTGSPYAKSSTSTLQSSVHFASQPRDQNVLLPAPAAAELGLGSAIVYVGSDGQLTVALPQTDSQAPAPFGYLPLNSPSNSSLPSSIPPPSSLRPPSSIASAKAQSVSSTSSSSSGKTPNQPKKSVGRPIVKVAPLPPSNIPLPNYPIPSTILSTTPSPTIPQSNQSPYSATPVTPFTPATPATPITPAITPAMPQPIPPHTEYYSHLTIDLPLPESDDMLLELPFIDYCP